MMGKLLPGKHAVGESGGNRGGGEGGSGKGAMPGGCGGGSGGIVGGVYGDGVGGSGGMDGGVYGEQSVLVLTGPTYKDSEHEQWLPDSVTQAEYCEK